MTWKAVDITVGNLPTKDNTKVTYPIKGLPPTAKEILIYAYIETGAGNADGHGDYHISVNPIGQEEVYVALAVHGYNQQAWSYNSINFWLPNPVQQEIYVHC